MNAQREAVLAAVRTIGRGAQTTEIAAVARCAVSDAVDALCHLESEGLVTVWAWAPAGPAASEATS